MLKKLQRQRVNEANSNSDQRPLFWNKIKGFPTQTNKSVAANFSKCEKRFLAAA